MTFFMFHKKGNMECVWGKWSGHCPTLEAMLSIRVLAVIHEVRSVETRETRPVTDDNSLPG